MQIRAAYQKSKRKDKSRVFYGCPLFKSEVKMTNKEKFKEIFGIEPDCGRCNPYPCEENDCKYWAECENQPGCPCDNWWDWEFKESTTKNDLGVDLISRADAIKAMQDKAKKLKNEDTINGLCGAVAILFDMPSVIPQEPKTGHWIVEKGGSYLGQRNACCSNCKDFYTNDWNVMNYCPNCGADMREVKE